MATKVKIDWSKAQYCNKCNLQMRPQTQKNSALVAHEKHGLCRRCANSKGQKTIFDATGQVCFKCKTYKTYENFTKSAECLSGHNTTCKKCKIFWIHGIDQATFDKLLATQDGKCAICKRYFEEFPGSRHIDHDHGCCGQRGKKACGTCIRGVLCGTCNSGIGMLQDSPEIALSSYKYLINTKKNKERSNKDVN
jgi:hypothetical protein